MKKIRIGNDVPLIWHIKVKDTKQPYDLTGKDLYLALALDGCCDKPEIPITDFTVSGNDIGFTFYGKDQIETGRYILILKENKGAAGMKTLDNNQAFYLVSHSWEEGGEDGLSVITEPIELTGYIEEGQVIEIIDNLEATATDAALSANQGRVLNERFENADETLSEESENIIKNNAVYKQYMDTKDIGDIMLQIDPDYYEKKYFTIEILSGNSSLSNAGNSDAQYRMNDGDTWESWLGEIEVKQGDVISFKATNGTTKFNDISDCTFRVFGNIMSLIFGDNFVGQTVISTEEQFKEMFKDSIGLVDAENLVLPALTLSNYCYREMFVRTGVVKAPKLPATTLSRMAYVGMFSECASLVSAPELPATTLGEYCYYAMFNRCTSLTEAPELPATTLIEGCYQEMFHHCENLSFVKCLATANAIGALTYWLDDVSETGTFIKATLATFWTTGANGIPSGWTVENAS